MAKKKDNYLIIFGALLVVVIIFFGMKNFGRGAIIPNNIFGYGLSLGSGTYGSSCGWSADSLNYHVGSNMVISLPNDYSYTFTPRLYCPFDYCQACSTWCSNHCNWVQDSCGTGISERVEHVITSSSGNVYVIGQTSSSGENMAHPASDCSASCGSAPGILRGIPIPGTSTEGDLYLSSLRSQNYAILSDAYQSALGRVMPPQIISIVEGGLNITVIHNNAYTYAATIPCQSVQFNVAPLISITGLVSNVINNNVGTISLGFQNNYKDINVIVDTSMTVNTLLGQSQLLTTSNNYLVPYGASSVTITYNPADPGTYNINLTAYTTTNIQFYTSTIPQISTIGSKQTSLVIKALCPYDCCNEGTYQIKLCQNNYACNNNVCNAPIQSCPYECCNAGTYQEKDCVQNGYSCQNNVCAASTKPVCPYDCCNEGTYQEKTCSQTGYACNNNACVAPTQCTTNSDCSQSICGGRNCNNNLCVQGSIPSAPDCGSDTPVWTDYPTCSWNCEHTTPIQCVENSDCVIHTNTTNDCTIFYTPKIISTQGTCANGLCSFNNAAITCSDWQLQLQNYKWYAIGIIALIIILLLRRRSYG